MQWFLCSPFEGELIIYRLVEHRVGILLFGDLIAVLAGMLQRRTLLAIQVLASEKH